jgi:methyl-accepting chemotaxis protein WspA
VKRDLKRRIILLAVVSALLPGAVWMALGSIERRMVTQTMAGQLDGLARSHLTQIVKDTHGTCQAYDAAVRDRLEHGLRLTRGLLARDGGVRLVPGTTTWQTVNQLSSSRGTVTLPRFQVGATVTSPELDGHPVVDESRQVSGLACSVFQRIDDDGNMLRAATNLREDGKRVTGFVMPATTPDGTPSPVIAAIRAGRQYSAPTMILGKPHLATYEPIKDARGEIIGMLGVGVPMGAFEALRRTVISTRVGKTGYVYVMGAQSPQRGVYVISKDGLRDGENIWASRDTSGRFFLQDIVTRAVVLGPGEVAFDRYPWRNPEDHRPRMKVVAFTYFEPWDWIIVAGAYEEEFYDARDHALVVMNRIRWMSILALLLVAILVAIQALVAAGRIARPLSEMTELAGLIADGDIERSAAAFAADAPPVRDASTETSHLRDAFRRMVESLRSLIGQVQRSGIQVTTSTTAIAASARQLEGTLAEQAASTQEVTAATREILATGNELSHTMDSVAESARDAARLATTSEAGLKGMAETMSRLLGATGSISARLGAIRDQASGIGGIVVTITKVADQTNLLSLNAAIEAEKAGEYGLGFSVVAREIRRLADQTAASTLDIERRVKAMHGAVASGVMEMDQFVEQVRHGAEEVGQIASQLAEIITKAQVLEPRIAAVHEGMQAQQQGAEQITEAQRQLTEGANQTRDMVREFNRAAENLTQTVAGLRAEVSRFKVG